MLQIYIDALRESANGTPCYVFSSSLDLVRTSDVKSVIEHLKDGWTLEAYCHDNVLEEKYISIEPEDIKFVLDELGIVSEGAISQLTLTYQCHYDTLQRLQSITLIVDTLVDTENGKESSGTTLTYTNTEGIDKALNLESNIIFIFKSFTRGENEMLEELTKEDS